MKKVCILSSVHIALDNRVFYREARSLVKANYDVTLIATHNREEVKDGVRIIPLPKVSRWRRPLSWLTLIRLAYAQEADIYHFHDPELLLVMPWLRLLTGKPTIYDIHEVYPEFIKVKDYMPIWLRYPIAWVFQFVEPILASLQSALVFSDDQIARAFSHINKPKTTLFNFPSRQFIENAKAATREVTPRPPVILHLGGHERNRGTGLMIEAFSRIHEIMPEAKLFLVGHFMPPDLMQEVQADIESHGISEAVALTGRVPFETIGEYLQHAAVGWVPWQPYLKNDLNVPTKLFEYMAYAIPIITSDLRSTRPFVQHGENGYLVAATDSQAHAHAILRLLQNPPQARKMGLTGQQMVEEQYNWDAEEKKLWALYEEILEEQ